MIRFLYIHNPLACSSILPILRSILHRLGLSNPLQSQRSSVLSTILRKSKKIGQKLQCRREYLSFEVSMMTLWQQKNLLPKVSQVRCECRSVLHEMKSNMGWVIFSGISIMQSHHLHQKLSSRVIQKSIQFSMNQSESSLRSLHGIIHLCSVYGLVYSRFLLGIRSYGRYQKKSSWQGSLSDQS